MNKEEQTFSYEFNADELNLLVGALQGINITGKDAEAIVYMKNKLLAPYRAAMEAKQKVEKEEKTEVVKEKKPKK